MSTPRAHVLRRGVAGAAKRAASVLSRFAAVVGGDGASAGAARAPRAAPDYFYDSGSGRLYFYPPVQTVAIVARGNTDDVYSAEGGVFFHER